MKGQRVGELEELALLSVGALDEPAYAVPVQRYIERAAGRVISMGAVYAVLARLESKGLLRSLPGEPTPRRGGKRTRIYDLTPTGMERLRERRRVRETIWRAIEGRST